MNKKIHVFIDSCAWNYLFRNQLDLARELPEDRFSLCVTREVEIEIDAIPPTGKDGADKRALKQFIADAIQTNSVQTTSVFGFASVEPDGSLSPIQVFGGFDQGTFQSAEDREWYESEAVTKLLDRKTLSGSGLGKAQADASLAVRSFGAIVLTDEHKGKNGPLKLARQQSGCIVHLSEDVEPSGLTLGAFIDEMIARGAS